MAKSVYANKGTTSGKVKTVYVEVSGKARKVKKIYANVGGVAKLCYDAIQGMSTVPSQSGTLTYTGSTLTQSWSGYDSAKMTISGTTTATNAGTYTATFTAKDGFQWSDGSTVKNVSWTIGRATISTTPSQSGSLTYNGSTKTPSWSNYDSTKMTLGGTTSGTNAGSYTATFTPKSNYKWSNGSTSAKSVTWTIDRATISTIPSQSGTLTYTGSSKSPSWSNYDTGKMTIGGTTSGTNAGSYSATFTPTSNYKWSDGTTSAKSVSWTIGKATGSLSLSATTASITTSGGSKQITVTRSGNGTISATSSNTSVAKCSVSGNVVTITDGGSNGSCTITISVAAGTNYTAPSSKAVSVIRDVFTISTTLGDTMSWAGYNWIVVHVESDRVYLALDHIYETCTFSALNKNAYYYTSRLANRAELFELALPEAELTKAISTTVNNVTSKIFAASQKQLLTEFSYLASSEANRVCRYNGTPTQYWTSSAYTDDLPYTISATGKISYASHDETEGFRPFVALKRS